MKYENKTISIIMPCLNEEKNIKTSIINTLEALDRLQIDGEIIVVNDGSIDKSNCIIKELILKDDRVKLIDHVINRGIGRSFWSGVQLSTKQLITMFPGDDENNQFDSLLFLNIANNVDIVVPFIVNTEIRKLHRIIISKIFKFIVNITFRLNLNYTNGAVIYNTTLLRKMNPISYGFFYQAEILIRLIRSGYLFAETPHYLSIRKSGKTKALSLPSLLELTRSYLLLLYKYIFMKNEFFIEIDKNSETYKRKLENFKFIEGKERQL